MGGLATLPGSTFCVPSNWLPTAAVYTTVLGQLVITYDAPLVAGAVWPGNWSRRDKGKVYYPDTAIAAGATVTLTGWHYLIDEPGGDTCQYRASPADILDAVTGLTAAPFADYPYSTV